MSDILSKIENKYTAGPDWVVEKGKVAEAKIIKECYCEIKSLRADNRKYIDEACEEYKEKRKAEKETRSAKEELAQTLYELDNLKAKILRDVTILLSK